MIGKPTHRTAGGSFRKLQIFHFANYRFRKIQIFISFRSVSFRFANYSKPGFRKPAADCDRVDVVWDSYREDSVKKAIRVKRGEGKRKKVADNT